MPLLPVCRSSCVPASEPAGRPCCSSWHSSSSCTGPPSDSSYTVGAVRQGRGKEGTGGEGRSCLTLRDGLTFSEEPLFTSLNSRHFISSICIIGYVIIDLLGYP